MYILLEKYWNKNYKYLLDYLYTPKVCFHSSWISATVIKTQKCVPWIVKKATYVYSNKNSSKSFCMTILPEKFTFVLSNAFIYVNL